MTVTLFAVVAVNTLYGARRSMGSFDTRQEAEAHAKALRDIFHTHHVEEVLWSLAPLGRAS